MSLVAAAMYSLPVAGSEKSGPQIYFLSDDGVFTLQQGLDPAKNLGVAISKVSGEAIPLTRPVQDQFKDVNFAHAEKACGIVFDNKYFLAVPTGSCSISSNNTKAQCELAGGTWTASTDNNKVFVYDILNTAWTSIDSFPSGFGSYKYISIDAIRGDVTVHIKSDLII